MITYNKKLIHLITYKKVKTFSNIQKKKLRLSVIYQKKVKAFINIKKS